MMAIVSVVLITAAASHSDDERKVIGRMLSTLVLVFAPALLAALYSLFFEKSKVYGSVDLLLACIVLLKLPVTWYWLEIYWPAVCGFTLFCGAVRVLEQRKKG